MSTDRHFRISPTWFGESEDTAEIKIELGNRILTRIADTEINTNRDFFRASATRLGLWFVDNWWRLRWETLSHPRIASVDWRLRHELNSADGGALWPPIMIYSSGDRIAFAPSITGRSVSGPQQYLPFDPGMVLADDYESELDRFIRIVISHCARTQDGEALRAIFEQINAERADAELAGWRRLEACLGFDPDQAPDEVINALIAFEEIVGEQGVEEAAHATPGTKAAINLGEAIEATYSSNLVVSTEISGAISDEWRGIPTASPYRFAEAAAASLRRLIGSKRGEVSEEDLAGIYRTRWSDLKSATATARGLPYAARLDVDDGTARLALQTQRPRERRFELCRILGDKFWHSDAKFGIVSRARTDRQKFQIAFAHIFLCPIDDLANAIDVYNPTEDSIGAAANTFNVHPSVVRNQLIYNGYIEYDPRQELEYAQA